MLKAKEVIALVKACGAAGVAELSIGELSIRFSTTTPVAETTSTNHQIVSVPTGQPEDPVHAFERDEQQLKEEQLDLMLIENPAKYEELLMAGDLEDAEGARH